MSDSAVSDQALLEAFESEEMPDLELEWSSGCQVLREGGTEVLPSTFDFDVESVDEALMLYPAIGEFFGIERSASCEESMLILAASRVLADARQLSLEDGELRHLAEDEARRADIRSGTEGWRGGTGEIAVEVDNITRPYCSATFISPVALVTGAHCFQGLFPKRDLGTAGPVRFKANVSINYRARGRLPSGKQDWNCAYGRAPLAEHLACRSALGSSAGNAGNRICSRRCSIVNYDHFREVNVTIPRDFLFKPPSSIVGVSNDVAVVVLPRGQRWNRQSGLDSKDYPRIWTGSLNGFVGNTVRIYGSGTKELREVVSAFDDRPMRNGRFRVSRIVGRAIRIQSAGATLCFGDSGGPIFSESILTGNPGTGILPHLIGTLSAVDTGFNKCGSTGPDSKSFGTALGPKIDLIDNAIKRTHGPQYRCRRFKDIFTAGGYRVCKPPRLF